MKSILRIGLLCFTFIIIFGAINLYMYPSHATVGELIRWNSDDKSANMILSNDDLTLYTSARRYTTGHYIRTTEGKSSGKWYWEIEIHNNTSGGAFVGIIEENVTDPSTSTLIMYSYDGAIRAAGSTTVSAYGATYKSGDIIGIALDMDSRNIAFYKNGIFLNRVPFLLNSGKIFPTVLSGSNWASQECKITANFGRLPFDIVTSNNQAWIQLQEEGYLPYDINNSNWLDIAPSNLVATAFDSEVKLNWSSVADAVSYKVKRSLISGGPYETVSEAVYGTSYSDKDVINGNTYYYVVSANKDGYESPNSNEVFATPMKDHVEPSPDNNVVLKIIMVNGMEKEYGLTIEEVLDFLDWYKYEDRDMTYFIFTEESNYGPYKSRKDYIIYDKIMYFEVNEY